jgi:hypothetical protein
MSDVDEPTGDDEPIEVSWYKRGLSIQQVAAKVGMHRRSVRRCLVEHDVPLRPQVAPHGADRWPVFFDALTMYVADHGHARLPYNHCVDGVGNLYRWLGRQCRRYRAGRLPAARAAALTRLGVDLDAPQGMGR